METQAGRLIGLATKPLADNAELHLAATGELRRRIENHAASQADLETLADSLERADLHPLRRRWQAALSLMTVLVSLPVLFLSARQFIGIAALSKSLDQGTSEQPGGDSQWNLSPRQRLILFGDENATKREDRWKPLWKSEPENPAFLALFASCYINENKTWTPEIANAVARTDPDNGWYPAIIAGNMTESVVTKRKQTDQEKKDFKTPIYDIKDAGKLDDVLSLIHQAAEKPFITTHEKDLYRMRLPLLPQRHDFVSQLPGMMYLASQISYGIRVRNIVDALSAGAQECAAKHDAAGFRRIIGDWEAISEKWTKGGLHLVDLLVAKNLYFGPAERFRDTALALGLEPEADRFSKLLELKKADKTRRLSSLRGTPERSLLDSRGSMFASLALPTVGRQVEHPPKLGDADLRPGRYAEHALFLRAASLASWILLGVAAGLASFHRLIRSPLAQRMSLRLFDVIKARDWSIIAAFGVLAPLLWYIAVVHLTPLSSREWSFNESGGVQAGCQFGSMLVLMLVLTVMLCSSRITKRGTVLGLSSPMPWLGWLAALSAALAIPAFGSIMPAVHSRSPLEWFAPYLLWTSRALLALPVLWLLIGACRTVLASPTHALRRSIIARMLLPTWIFGMLVMAASLPIHHALEGQWIRKDTLFEINADKPAMSRYEWDVTQQLRKELLEMIR